MATSMFVTGIPNGTSLDVQKGTALNLLKLQIYSSRENSEGGYTFDPHRMDQLAGCLGISKEEATQICQRVITGEAAEQVISEFTRKSQEIKEQTTQRIAEKLKALRG